MTTVRITDAGGNKPTFVQWDVDRVLYISGVSSTPCLHFANAELKRAIVVEATDDNGRWKCKVPNFILQFACPMVVSVFTQPEGGEGRTEATVVIGVQPKKKPQDYDYTENIGYVNWVNLTAEIQRMLDDGELKGDPPVVEVEQTSYGNKVTFTGANGPQTIHVLNGMTAAVKNALLDMFQHVAYADSQGKTYYDALYDALNESGTKELVSITAAFTQGSAVIYTTDALNDLKPLLIVTANYDDGTTETVTSYTLSGVLTEGTSVITVSYGGKTDTFNVTVTTPTKTLSSITATFDQGQATIYDSDSLDVLRQYLVVTATYTDSSTATINNYTLTGTLVVGSCSVIASYGGESDTFVVDVTSGVSSVSITWSGTGTDKTVSPNVIDAVDCELYLTIPFTEGAPELTASAEEGGNALAFVTDLYSDPDKAEWVGWVDVSTGTVRTDSIPSSWSSRPSIKFGVETLVAPRGYYARLRASNNRSAFDSNADCTKYLNEYADSLKSVMHTGE